MCKLFDLEYASDVLLRILSNIRGQFFQCIGHAWHLIIPLQTFSVETVISGKVHVNKLDRNGSFVKSVGPKYIVEIIKFAFAGLMPDYLKIDGSTMRITSSGQCEFTYAVEQQVTVSSN